MSWAAWGSECTEPFVYFLIIVHAILGSWVAEQKGRSSMEGCLLGGLFLTFGVMIELFLPNVIATPFR